MAKPKTKTKKIEAWLTEDQHQQLLKAAQGQPLSVYMVTKALEATTLATKEEANRTAYTQVKQMADQVNPIFKTIESRLKTLETRVDSLSTDRTETVLATLLNS
jgi:hypothetical protein